LPRPVFRRGAVVARTGCAGPALLLSNKVVSVARAHAFDDWLTSCRLYFERAYAGCCLRASRARRALYKPLVERLLGATHLCRPSAMYKPQAGVQASGGVLGGVPLLQADERPRGPIAERDHLPLVKPRTSMPISAQ